MCTLLINILLFIVFNIDVDWYCISYNNTLTSNNNNYIKKMFVFIQTKHFLTGLLHDAGKVLIK